MMTKKRILLAGICLLAGFFIMDCLLFNILLPVGRFLVKLVPWAYILPLFCIFSSILAIGLVSFILGLSLGSVSKLSAIMAGIYVLYDWLWGVVMLVRFRPYLAEIAPDGEVEGILTGFPLHLFKFILAVPIAFFLAHLGSKLKTKIKHSH